MSADHSPIPREALPPGWGPAEVCDERYAYRRSRPSIELIAARRAGDHAHPGLGLGHCWELRYRHRVGELSVSESIGRVTTRGAALEGLLECMSRIHDGVEELCDPMEIEAALRRVSLENRLPERRQQAPR
ncbi:hypothetical protein [Natrononativus amylolyticus]|uniref:hypothetical protein n=1 Tax=Natrononativus amylolyticus TaxID=2963434 RepID=UPI0020CD6E55|nr:hypothetical protein [Natrononativus amylolyticus]